MLKKICYSVFILSLIILPIEIVAKDTSSDSKKASSSTTTIFIANSTIDAVKKIALKYEKLYSLQKINIAHSGSGTLARQISEGAPAEIFISASKKWVDYLDEKEVLISDSIKPLPLKTSLILIAKKGIKNVRLDNFAEYLIKNNAKISLGDPKSVPAGAYTHEFLIKNKIFEKIKNNIVYVNAVRASLNYIKLGEADLAIVYSTDVLSIPNQYEYIATIDSQDHSPIKYYIALVSENASPAATQFYNYLFTDDALKIYKEFGF